MSFQAYLDTIKKKTGRGPEDFKKLAEKKGFLEKGKLKSEVKAGEIVAWLKEDFELGHGHAMNKELLWFFVKLKTFPEMINTIFLRLCVGYGYPFRIPEF